MTMGERIKFFRKRKGLTQRQFGMLLGFSEDSSDVRVCQYETEIRKPKEALLNEIADVLDVHPAALDVPDVSTTAKLMHVLFELEDKYGLEPIKIFNGHNEYGVGWKTEICLHIDGEKNMISDFGDLLSVWLDMVEKLKREEITQEEYDNWRYQFGGDDL